MSKAILVMDMPERCSECQLCIDWKPNRYFCSGFPNNGIDIEDEKIRPSWCPLKEFPEKAYHPDWCDNGRYDKGYNDCIDEILGGVER